MNTPLDPSKPWEGKDHEKGLSLDADENREVEKVWNLAKENRETYDDHMRNVQTAMAGHGAQLEGIEYSLKDLDSFRGKVARKKGEKEAADVAKEANDLNRYTLTFPTDQYTDGVLASRKYMKLNGFDLVKERSRNAWEEHDYKGYNSTWKNRENGQLIEVQFHTPEGLAAKEQNHLLYELDRADPKRKMGDERAKAIRALQADRYKNVPIPPGHERIMPPSTPTRLEKVTEEAKERVRVEEQALAERKAAEKALKEAEKTGKTDPGADKNPTGPAPPRLFSRGAIQSNQDIIDSGNGLPRNQETVNRAAEASGVDLGDVEVFLIEEADEIRYLDSENAYAYTPWERNGDQIRLGPASFADEETLVATLAHEKTHVEQFRSGTALDTQLQKDLEVEAYASEAPALERFRQHDSNSVHDRDNVRPLSSDRDPSAGDPPLRSDQSRHDPPQREDGSTSSDPRDGLSNPSSIRDESDNVVDRQERLSGDRDGDGTDKSSLTQSKEDELDDEELDDESAEEEELAQSEEDAEQEDAEQEQEELVNQEKFAEQEKLEQDELEQDNDLEQEDELEQDEELQQDEELENDELEDEAETSTAEQEQEIAQQEEEKTADTAESEEETQRQQEKEAESEADTTTAQDAAERDSAEKTQEDRAQEQDSTTTDRKEPEPAEQENNEPETTDPEQDASEQDSPEQGEPQRNDAENESANAEAEQAQPEAETATPVEAEEAEAEAAEPEQESSQPEPEQPEEQAPDTENAPAEQEADAPAGDYEQQSESNDARVADSMGSEESGGYESDSYDASANNDLERD